MAVFARISRFVLALLLAVVSVLPAFVVILVLAVNLVDWSEHKDVLISLVERYSDWDVEQLGDIEIDLYLPAEVRIQNVVLKQRAPGSSLAELSARYFEVNIAPLSLFFRDRIFIHHLHTSGARVITREPPEEPPPDTGPFSIPFIKSARVRDSELVFWVDGLEEDVDLHLTALDVDSPGQGQNMSIVGRGSLEGLDAKLAGDLGDLGNLAEDAVSPFNLEGAVAGDEFAVQGMVKSLEELDGRALVFLKGDVLPQLAERLGIDLNLPAYELAFSVSSANNQVNLENIEATLGESTVRGDASLQLTGPKPSLRAELSSPLLRKRDVVSLFGEDAAPGESAQPGSSREPPSFDFLDALNADVSLKLAEYQGDELDALSGLDVNVKVKDGLLKVAGLVAVANEAFKLDAQMGPTREKAQSARIPFQLALSMAGDTLASKGEITAGARDFAYTAQVAGKGDNLSAVAESFGIALGDAPDYQLELAMAGSAEQVSFEDVRLTFGESSVQGTASLQLNEPTPSLQAELFSPLLREQDIATLIPTESDDDGSAGMQIANVSTGQATADAEAALDFLEALNGTLSYRVADYQGERLGIDSGQIEGRLQDGQLALAARAGAGGTVLSLDSTLGPQQQQQGRPTLPLSLELRTAGDSLSAAGFIASANGDLALRADAIADGDNLAGVAELFGISLADVPAYKVQAALAASPQGIIVQDMEATVGYSHIYGNVNLRLDREKPYLRADLGSSLLREQDLASLVPQDSEQRESAEGENSTVAQLDFLNGFDADISLTATELQGERLGRVSSGDVTARVQEGALSLEGRIGVEDLEFTVSGQLGAGQNGADVSADPASLPFSLEIAAAEDLLRTKGQLTAGPDGLGFELETSATGNSLDRIAQAFDFPIEEPPPYTLSFTANKSYGGITVPDLLLSLGESSLQAEATLQLNQPRPFLNADVQIVLLRQQDLGGLMPGGETENEYVFSREPFDFGILRQLDAELRLSMDRYVGPEGAELVEGMTIQAQLENGTLNLHPIKVGLAGGELDGRVQLDTSQDVAALKTGLSAERVGLNQLVSPFFDLQEADMEARGGMGADLDLTGAGRSPHELVSDLDGEFSWAIYNGAVPALVIEALGLDLLEGAVSWFGETVTTGVKCGVGRFNITEGTVHTETFLLSTTDSLVLGDGRVDLAAEEIDLKLEARAKDFSIFAGDSPVKIEGPLNNISVNAMTDELLAKIGAAALLALVNPALAVVPFTELGDEDEGECAALRKELERIRAESQ